MDIDWSRFIEAVLGAIVSSLIGIVLFAACFAVLGAITPFSVRKELEENRNVALAVLLGAAILGLSIIIASAVG